MKMKLLSVLFLSMFISCGDDSSDNDIYPEYSGIVVGPFDADLSSDSGEWYYMDLDTGGTKVTETDAWDLRFRKSLIQLNPGKSTAAKLDTPFDSVTSSPSASQFQSDGLTGYVGTDGKTISPERDTVFNGEDKWYNYDQPGKPKIDPKTDRTYVVKTDQGTNYVIQMLSYYGAAGESAQLSLEYKIVLTLP